MKATRKIPDISQILLILTFGYVIIDSLFFGKGIVKIIRLRRELENIHSRIEAIKKDNAEIRLRIEKLQSDPLTIETIAREELNMARPGEIVYQLPMQKSQKLQSITPNIPDF